GVDREPLQKGPRDLGVNLQNRLFLGFHEVAESIEVISYNEAMGRFEFQVIEDYREGAKPRLKYAPRALCVACHQNQAPIFPEKPWSESSADQDLIVARLAEHLTEANQTPEERADPARLEPVAGATFDRAYYGVAVPKA